MEYFIKISRNFDENGKEIINFNSDGFTEFEIIGILTYYRDQIEAKMMHREKPKKQESDGKD